MGESFESMVYIHSASWNRRSILGSLPVFTRMSVLVAISSTHVKSSGAQYSEMSTVLSDNDHRRIVSQNSVQSNFPIALYPVVPAYGGSQYINAFRGCNAR